MSQDFVKLVISLLPTVEI